MTLKGPFQAKVFHDSVIVCCIQVCHGNSMEVPVDMLSTNFSHRGRALVTSVRMSTDFR